MHETEQICLSKFSGLLIGYATYNHSIVYVTPEAISVINIHSRPETAPINGNSVLNFVINNRNEVVILYKQRFIEVRRMDRLRQVVKKFENINITQGQDYPLLKILNQELYLVYPSAIQIISLKDGSRSKYTDFVPEPQYHNIYDLNLLNLIQSLSIGVLHLRNRLIVAIIPCTITQLYIQGLSQIICLHPNISTMHPKTTYLAVLAEEILIKIFDLVSLKQICQIELPSIDALIEIETDPQSSYILVHYIDKQTAKPLRHFIYKINEALFYNQNRGEAECQQFILFFFELKTQEYLSPLNYHCQGSIHTFTLYYFKDQSLNLLLINRVKSYKQSQEEIQSITDLDYWKENLEWRDIISTYLQLEEQNFGHTARKLIYSEEERQLEEYYQIAKDFDSIVQKFSQILAEKSNHFRLTQKQIDEQWQIYLQSIAKERNFMRETMSLFKIDYKIVKEPHQEKNLIGIELETCIKDIESRESRVDAKIREKKMQLASQQQIKKEKKNVQEQTKVTEAQIKKQQEEYQKFVAEYLAQIQRRQAEEAGSKTKHAQQTQNSDLSPRLTLQLPILSQEERKLIQHKSLDLSQMSSLSSQKEEVNPAWHQFVLIMSQIEHELSPLEASLGKLVTKMDKLEHQTLQQMKSNQTSLQEEMSINIQAEVKKNCRGMLSCLKDRITRQMSLAMEKLQKFEQKAIQQNEQTIEKFKEFAKLQVRHRIEIYHRSRRQLQLTAHRICKQQAQSDNRLSF